MAKRQIRRAKRSADRVNKVEEVKEKATLNFFERIFVNIAIKYLTKKINNMKGSWKTTITGICTLLGAISLAGIAIFDGDPDTQPNIEMIILALAGLGLWASRDNNVTSREAGAE